MDLPPIERPPCDLAPCEDAMDLAKWTDLAALFIAAPRSAGGIGRQYMIEDMACEEGDGFFKVGRIGGALHCSAQV